MKSLNNKKYLFLTLSMFSLSFACFNPTSYAAWPQQLQMKELAPGQKTTFNLPQELAEEKHKIELAYKVLLHQITNSSETTVSDTGTARNGFWTITFTKDESTKRIACLIKLNITN